MQKKQKIFVNIQMPVDDDNKLIVAAAITQAAATLYARPGALLDESVLTAYQIYAEVVTLLQEADRP
jgi:hypothetical protein